MYSIYIHIYGINLTKYRNEFDHIDITEIHGIESDYSGDSEPPIYIGKVYGVIDPEYTEPVEYPNQATLDKDWQQILSDFQKGIEKYYKFFEILNKSNAGNMKVSDEELEQIRNELDKLQEMISSKKPEKIIMRATS